MRSHLLDQYLKGVLLEVHSQVLYAIKEPLIRLYTTQEPSVDSLTSYT